MNYEEAITVLETIGELYPKYEVSIRKGQMLAPQLMKMDYARVLENLSDYVATHPYAPTLAEIAAFPVESNEHLDKISVWRAEAAKVPDEVKQNFHKQMIKLLKDKTHVTDR
ncbi:hypothetical protein LG329_16700 [Virgibacillus necropolis]|uniref:hypothetical protein n=1 Tax=Virgibacillus necropolis TaxID=163877 RepID=UPI00384BDDA0